MGKQTGISWADSTRNFWAGCTKISPACDACYAAAFHEWINKGSNWGPGAPRIPYLDGAARDLRKWNRQAADDFAAGRRKRWTVFVNSQSDIFDNEVPNEWREYAFQTIRECSMLTFLLVTKRIGNAVTMLPRDWGDGYPNVWLLSTVCNQEEADRDIPKLLAVPAMIHGVSYEPAIEAVKWWKFLAPTMHVDWTKNAKRTVEDVAAVVQCARAAVRPVRLLDWIIIGGESKQRGHQPRPFDIEWARLTIKQCAHAGVACFVKQLGSAILVRNDSISEWPDEDEYSDGIPDEYQPQYQGEGVCIKLRDPAGADSAHWPADLRVQEFPA